MALSSHHSNVMSLGQSGVGADHRHAIVTGGFWTISDTCMDREELGHAMDPRHNTKILLSSVKSIPRNAPRAQTHLQT